MSTDFSVRGWLFEYLSIIGEEHRVVKEDDTEHRVVSEVTEEYLVVKE